jgi:hypothetical protein
MSDFIELFIICLIPLAMGWWPCSECCATVEEGDDCPECSSTPKYLKVVINNPGEGIGTAAIETDFVVGGTLTNESCDQCVGVPNTYTIQQEGTDPCRWRLDLCQCPSSTSLSEPRIDMRVILSSGTYYLECRIEIGFGPSGTNRDRVLYRKNLGTTQPNCLQFSNEVLDYDSMEFDDGACDGWEALEVTVSAANGPETDSPQCGYCEQDTHLQTRTVKLTGTAPVNNVCTDCAELLDLVVTVTFTGNFGATCCTSTGTYVGSSCTYSYTLEFKETEVLLSLARFGFGTEATWTLTGLSNPRDCSTAITLAFATDAPGGACTSFSNLTQAEVSVAA